MTDNNKHSWDVSIEEAVAIQNRLRGLVQKTNGFDPAQIKKVAGIDISLKDEGQAAIVVLAYPELELLERVVITHKVTFPYVPGLLSFREIPVILAAMEHLKVTPDLLMLDGQGYAHPRRFGIACHLGVILDLPSIGCAKSILVGHHKELGPLPGDEVPVIDKGETVAVALRTKKNSKPIIVSIGNKIDLPTAVEFVKNCGRGYRLPETTRLADKYSRSPDLSPTPTATEEPQQGQLF